jgi:lipoprotein-anchoring transpeptidase ErfK/SrfK
LEKAAQKSSGCIRLTNEDIVDLYNRIGAKVIVFGTAKPAAAAQ